MKLSGWKRIGIVLSAIWFFGAFITIGIITYNYNSRHGENVAFYEFYEQFDDGFVAVLRIPDNQVLEWKQAGNNLKKKPKYDAIVSSTIILILPIVSGWSIFYILYWTVMWITKGFKEDAS